MKKILRFDSTGGASGDMVLAAMVELGVDPAFMQAEVEKLSVEPFTIRVEEAEQNGLHGTRVHVDTGEHHHAGHHHHRHFSDIRKMIQESSLADGVKERSIAVFQRLAEAEGKVHNIDPEKVHFHEVGALDSIVDMVGACVGLESLGVEGVVVGPLPLGQGTVECAHGTMPVPVPATVELLKEHPTIQTEEPYELVTPTGAALLVTWKTMSQVPVECKIESVGHAFGHRTLNHRPNLMRVFILQAQDTQATRDVCLLIECNLDDTTPELLGAVSDQLFAAGAFDVYLTPIQMKKQRPGSLLSVLCAPDLRPAMLDILFRGTTTFGVRESLMDRTLLPRHSEEVETEYGPVRVKFGRWKGSDVTASPEMDDCIERAEEKGVSARQVYEAALRNIRR